jgi:hypothetical protein
MMKDEIRRELSVFCAAYDDLVTADDWSTLSDQDRGVRLRDALRLEDLRAGRPFRFDHGLDYAHIVRQLDEADRS